MALFFSFSLDENKYVAFKQWYFVKRTLETSAFTGHYIFPEELFSVQADFTILG